MMLVLFIVVLLVIILCWWFHQRVYFKPPATPPVDEKLFERHSIDQTLVASAGNRFRKSESGLYELYAEGNPYERGLSIGLMYEELNHRQEEIFFEGVLRILPSIWFMRLLKYIIAWMNRNLDKQVPLEYRQEIAGVSKHGAEKFNWIGPHYWRKLNYHAAHDIGHALRNMNVACTAFVVQGEKSTDGKILIGRNFDFTVGDEFAKTKIIQFIKPEKGIPHAFISWPGMMGCVSGMNTAGLTVSLNAAKSATPKEIGTPISIIARQIVQYASSIEEAKEILQQQKSFVSETILVGSAKDGRVAMLEKRPHDFDVVEGNSDCFVCANHFQGAKFGQDELNGPSLVETASVPRQLRAEQLLARNTKMNERDVATVLRDRLGLNEEDRGFQNETVMNQLLAHHAVIFKPQELKMWVSAFPYQLGKFVCYDLNRVFAEFPSMETDHEICEASLEIPADEFLTTKDYQQFLRFKSLKDRFDLTVRKKQKDMLSDADIAAFENSNPHYFFTHELLGDLFALRKEKKRAMQYYQNALARVIPNLEEKVRIENKLKNLS